MAHIILMNPELDQVETHKVDTETFLKVYDLLHPKVEDITKGMTFGQATRTPEVMAEVLPVVDPVADAMANSTFDEPELEDFPQFGKQYRLTGGSGDKAISNGDSWKDSEVKPEPEPVKDDKAFAESLQALFG